MAVKFTNNAKTTLASGITSSATSATVTDGSVFPSLSSGEHFYCTFDDGTNNEIVKVTARSGNTLTIVRAADNTTARAFSSGNQAELRATAALLTDIQENIAAKSANQTVYNTTTASSATTYDVGTDPGVEGNAMVFLNGVLQHHDTISFSGSTLTFDTAPPNGMALEVIIDNLINLQSSNLTVDTFTAANISGTNNPQTDFTLSDTPAAEQNLIVFVDGVFQAQDAYTISNEVLTMTDGVTAGLDVTVYVINPVNIGTPSDSTVTSAKLSGDITTPGALSVSGAFTSQGIDDNADATAITISSDENVTFTSNVGIGVAPTHNFNQQAAGAVEARFRSTDNDCFLQISSDTDEGQDSVLQFLSGTTTRGSIIYDHNTSQGSQNMIFKTGDNTKSVMTLTGDGNLKFAEGTGNLGNRYLIVNSGSGNDGGLILQRENTSKWQINNEATTEDLNFYSYGASQVALHLDYDHGHVVLGNGVGLHTDTLRSPNLSITSSFSNALNFATAGATNAGRGFYLVTVVREGASVGTSIVLLVGLSTGSAVIIYHTISSNSLVAQASGGNLQIRSTGGSVTCHATAIPIGVTGLDS